jgi:hypothetical protein
MVAPGAVRDTFATATAAAGVRLGTCRLALDDPASVTSLRLLVFCNAPATVVLAEIILSTLELPVSVGAVAVPLRSPASWTNPGALVVALLAPPDALAQAAAVELDAVNTWLADGVPVTVIPLTLATVGVAIVPDRSPPLSAVEDWTAVPAAVRLAWTALVMSEEGIPDPGLVYLATTVELAEIILSTLAVPARVGAVAVPDRSPASWTRPGALVVALLAPPAGVLQAPAPLRYVELEAVPVVDSEVTGILPPLLVVLWSWETSGCWCPASAAMPVFPATALPVVVSARILPAVVSSVRPPPPPAGVVHVPEALRKAEVPPAGEDTDTPCILATVGEPIVPLRSPLRLVEGWTAVLAAVRLDWTALVMSEEGIPLPGFTYLLATASRVVWVALSSWVLVTAPEAIWDVPTVLGLREPSGARETSK